MDYFFKYIEKIITSDDGKQKTVYEYYLNSQRTDEYTFCNFIDKLFALRTQKISKPNFHQCNNRLMSVTVEIMNGDFSLEMYEYDSNYYLIYANGKTPLKTPKAEIDFLGFPDVC